MKSHEIRMAGSAFGDLGDDIKPVIQPGGSDSAALDNTFEVLVRAGRAAPMAKTLLIPEAWNARSPEQIAPAHRALYAYCNAVMEPWDRSEEHTSELQSLMRISYAVFFLKKKNLQQPSRSTTSPPRHGDDCTADAKT